MQKRNLGSTDILVSPIGLGTVKFGRNTGVKYPEHFTLPSDQQITSLLSFAKEQGINLLDTAPAYGSSESRIGKLLVGKRDEWVICSKVGEHYRDGHSTFNYTQPFIKQSVQASLKRLRTDYLDILLIHSDGCDTDIIKQYDVFATLEQLKQQGDIRAYGMSTKTVQGGELSLPHADVVMVTYNPTDTTQQAVLTLAHQLHKGVLIKKALASGHLNRIASDQPVQTAMDFIFHQPAVSSVIIGTVNLQHLTCGIKCVKGALADCI